MATVYVRKNIFSISPPTLTDASSDEDDFVTDPEQMFDRLPQPFRMINKVFNMVLDDAWDIISDRELARLKEAQKVRPPLYQCSVQLPDWGSANVLRDSGDGRFIFLGLEHGLLAVDSLSHAVVASWDEADLCVHAIETCLTGVQTYLIATIDDKGIAKVFCYAYESINLIKVLNESSEGAPTNTVSRIWLSQEGDYMALAMENKQDVWVEVFKLPRDNWLREIEAAHNTSLKQQQQQKTPQQQQQQQVDETISKEKTDGGDEKKGAADQTENVEPAQGKSGDSEKTDSEIRSPSPPRMQTPTGRISPTLVRQPEREKMNLSNLSKPTLVLRIRPPFPLQGNNAPSPNAALKSVDDGAVIGTGVNHCLTSQHLETRRLVFEQQHTQLHQYIKSPAAAAQSQDARCDPNLVFLNAGRMLPAGMESTANAGRPNSLAIYWSGTCHLYHYNLLKQAKDVDHKPELVWPNSSAITAIGTTPCTSLLALGLGDGTLVIWDRYLGIPQNVQRVTTSGSIQSIEFVDPTAVADATGGGERKNNQEQGQQGPGTSGAVVTTSDGVLCMVPTTEDGGLPVVQIADSVGDEESHRPFVVLKPLASIPRVILAVRKNGEMMLFDISKGHTLCEMTLPDTHQVTQPWNPILTLGAGGQMLYVRGSQMDSKRDYVPNSGLSSIFIFQLRLFPTLDRYWKRAHEPLPFQSHVTVDKMCASLLSKRLSEIGVRQSRMQDRWFKLQDEAKARHKHRDAHSSKTNGSIKKARGL